MCDLEAIRLRLEESRQFRANLQRDFWAELSYVTFQHEEDNYSPRSHREVKTYKLSSVDSLATGCRRHGVGIQ